MQTAGRPPTGVTAWWHLLLPRVQTVVVLRTVPPPSYHHDGSTPPVGHQWILHQPVFGWAHRARVAAFVVCRHSSSASLLRTVLASDYTDGCRSRSVRPSLSGLISRKRVSRGGDDCTPDRRSLSLPRYPTGVLARDRADRRRSLMLFSMFTVHSSVIGKLTIAQFSVTEKGSRAAFRTVESQS